MIYIRCSAQVLSNRQHVLLVNYLLCVTVKEYMQCSIVCIVCGTEGATAAVKEIDTRV